MRRVLRIAKLVGEMIESHILETKLSFRTAFAGTRRRISVTRSSLPKTASTDDKCFCVGKVMMEEGKWLEQEEAIDPVIRLQSS